MTHYIIDFALVPPQGTINHSMYAGSSCERCGSEYCQCYGPTKEVLQMENVVPTAPDTLVRATSAASYRVGKWGFLTQQLEQRAP